VKWRCEEERNVAAAPAQRRQLDDRDVDGGRKRSSPERVRPQTSRARSREVAETTRHVDPA
jgi:hypothetical protein